MFIRDLNGSKMDRVEIDLDACFMTESQANEAKQKFADYKKRQTKIAAALLPPRSHQQLLKHVAQHAVQFVNLPQKIRQNKSNIPQSSAFLQRNVVLFGETKRTENPMPITSIGPPTKSDRFEPYQEWKKNQPNNLPDVWKKVDVDSSLLADQVADDEFELPKSLKERSKVVYAAENARGLKDDISSPHVPQSTTSRKSFSEEQPKMKPVSESVRKDFQPQPMTSETSTFASPKSKNDLTSEIPETPVSNITGSFAQDLSCRIENVNTVNSAPYLSAKSYFSATEPDAAMKQSMPSGSDDDALGKKTRSNHKSSTQCQIFQRSRIYMGTNQEIIEQYSMLRQARRIDKWLTEGEAFALMALLMGIIVSLFFRAYFLEK